ncbi:MAG TPA: hypothetical protein VKI00_16090 [Mycobacterium sp.]|uniref:hypothetical protein n=1 Tax=Mycobacterium sp. TaxID=1785 RepID=UPI002D0BD0F7|nr:hypothetical protein [Mycobacterium sp.]HME77104.1 hypothetical protein [Mycobacterium sp.]
MAEATLKIKGVTQDPRDSTGLSFVLQFTRNLTQHERETVPALLTLRFLPTEPNGPDTVVLRKARKEWFTLPEHQRRLKALVAEAEAVAERNLAQDTSAEGQAAARAEETRRELEAINWDDDQDDSES